MEEITLRNVTNEQVYDSYMGILRISPNTIDGELLDDTTLHFSNPKDGDKDRRIILSDSDGIELGPYFIPKVRRTEIVVDTEGNTEQKDVINMTFNNDDTTYIVKNYSIRSTLIVNKEQQSEADRIMPVLVYTKNTRRPLEDTFDVISYPIESPHDSSYFNTGNVKQLNGKPLIDYNSSVPVHEQLEQRLFEAPKSWYDANITNKDDIVKIDGKIAYTHNKDYEAVPILYTKDYVLGTYPGHTGFLTNEIQTKFFGSAVEPSKVKNGTGESLYTRLSYIQLDGVVWDFMKEILSGDIRHSDGRYKNLGVNQNESLTQELFDKINVDTEIEQNAPILGINVASGTVVYHAMPWRRWIFHALRQELRNKIDFEGTSGNLKKWHDAGKITPIPRKCPGFINSLSKDYILCDGKEVTYDQYPSMNTENPNLFVINDLGKTELDGKKPKSNTAWQNGVNIYNAIKKSNTVDGKLKTPNLLTMDQSTMRYIRSLNWTCNQGSENRIVFTESTPVYSRNTHPIEIVEGSDWGTCIKDIAQTGNYRTNIDFKLRKTKHCHYLFYKSETANQNAQNATSPSGTSNDIDSLTYSAGGNFEGFGIANPWTGIYQAPYRPYYWNSDATANSISLMTGTAIGGSNTAGGAMHGAVDGIAQVRYSFNKRAIDPKDQDKHLANHFKGHTPMPSAGLFAWKVQDNKMQNTGHGDTPSELNAGKYVIQNKEQAVISTNLNTRYHQLNQMNKAEGLAPIAHKGGTEQAKTNYQSIYCEARHHGHLGRKSRYRGSYQGFTGGYELGRDSNGVITTDIPRCVTSLPVVDIMEEINNPTVDEPVIETEGGQQMPDTKNISHPPSINLLPLFKI